MPRASRKPTCAAAAQPGLPPVDVMVRSVEVAQVLDRIGTPEAAAAIAELAEAGERLAAAFTRASGVILAAIPTPPTAH